MSTLNIAGTQSGTAGLKGITAQYQKAGTTNGTTIGPYDSGNIIGTVPPGKTGIKQISGVVQRSTDPMVCGQLSNNQADNFLAVTSGQGVVPTVNAAQLASAGKSLAPEHE